MLPWPKVQRRIAQLIKEDRFYTEAEQDRFDNIDPIAIREALAERGIVNGELVDEEKLDNDPFIQRVMADVEAISRESVPADEPEQPSPHNLRVLVSDEEYAAARGTLRERTSYDPAVPPYNVGDIVYLDDRPHQITELRDDTVQLLPTGMSYPIYGLRAGNGLSSFCGRITATTSIPNSCLQIWIRWTRTFGMCWPMA